MCPISGGNWNNAATAGVWAFNLNNVRSNSNNNVGFRADSGSPRKRQRYGGTEGDAFRRAASAAAKSARCRHSSRAAMRRGIDRLAAV
jgi:hypothetical protein